MKSKKLISKEYLEYYVENRIKWLKKHSTDKTETEIRIRELESFLFNVVSEF